MLRLQTPAYCSIPALLVLALILPAALIGQSSGVDSDKESRASAVKIERLFDIILTADEKQERAARTEVMQIYSTRGLPTVADVGDEAAYEFVALIATEPLEGPTRAALLSKVEESATRNAIPSDAATFFKARLRFDKVTQLIAMQPPTHPDLRDLIEQMSEADQAARQREGFDAERMQSVDQANAVPLAAILDKYGLPTYTMVGRQAADDFIVMIQHQSAQFRQRILPNLKSNVDAGQADPETYAMVYDRSQRDLGKKQFYGVQLECAPGEKLHEAPIEDEDGLDRRRAELGLIRAKLYERIGLVTMPQFCPPTASKN